MPRGAPALHASSTPARSQRWPCRRGGNPSRRKHRTSLDEMIGTYKRSKWLAEQEALRAAAAGLARGDRQSDHAGRPRRRQAHANRPHPGGFPEWPHAGVCGHRAEFCACRRRRCRPPAGGERGRFGERYILGGENLTLKQLLDLLARVSGRPAPRCAAAPCRGDGGGLCRRGGLAAAWPRAANPARGRTDGAPQHVCQRRQGASRAWFCSGAGCRGPGAGSAMVRGQRLRRAGGAQRVAEVHAA